MSSRTAREERASGEVMTTMSKGQGVAMVAFFLMSSVLRPYVSSWVWVLGWASQAAMTLYQCKMALTKFFFDPPFLLHGSKEEVQGTLPDTLALGPIPNIH